MVYLGEGGAREQMPQMLGWGKVVGDALTEEKSHSASSNLKVAHSLIGQSFSTENSSFCARNTCGPGIHTLQWRIVTDTHIHSEGWIWTQYNSHIKRENVPKSTVLWFSFLLLLDQCNGVLKRLPWQQTDHQGLGLIPQLWVAEVQLVAAACLKPFESLLTVHFYWSRLIDCFFPQQLSLEF